MFFKKLFKSEPARKPQKKAATRKGGSTKRTEQTRKHRQKFAVEDLRIGMFVVELDIPWEQSSFMFQGLELKSADDILSLQR